jgi:hypothetical protein
LALIACVGCSSPTIELPRVSGTVTYQSAPVEGAMVVFHPTVGDQLPAQAKTDDAGRFEMQTHVGQGEYQSGLAAGKYLVEIRKTEIAADFTRPPRHLLPEKYADPKASGLTADVSADGAEDLVFALE